MSALRHRLGDALRHLRLAGRHDDRAAVERLLPLLRQPKLRPGTIIWRGRPLRYADAPSLYYQLAEIHVARAYDFPAEPSTPSPRILDVGGNLGLAALRFRELHPAARITTFEPDPALAALLRANLAAAGDTATELAAAAAWTHDSEIGFHSTGDDSGSIRPDSAQRVPCVDLARWLAEPVDFLKLDIEGAEFELLAHLHAAGALVRVRRLFLELHHWRSPAAPRFHEALSLLADAGFRYRLLSAEIFPARAGWTGLHATSNLVAVHAWRDAPPAP